MRKFTLRDNWLTFDQMVDDLRLEFIWSDRVPYGTTDNVCLKFPVNINMIPPIVLCDYRISRSVRSKSSMPALWTMVFWSYIIKTQSVNTLANCTFCFILQTWVFLMCKSIGRLNVECAVFLPWIIILRWCYSRWCHI